MWTLNKAFSRFIFAPFCVPGGEKRRLPAEVQSCRTRRQQSKCPDISNPRRRAGKCAELHGNAAVVATDGEEAELLMLSRETEGDQCVEIKDLLAS